MKASYRIHAAEGYIEETFEGSITMAALMAFLREIMTDPKMSPDLNGIADFRDASIDLSYEEMLSVVEVLRSAANASRGQWAFVVPGPRNFGMTRMFQSLSEGVQSEVRTFDTLDEARGFVRCLRGPRTAPEA